MKLPTGRVVWAILGFILVVGLGGWWRTQRGRGKLQTLPNGSVLRLENVSYGTNHFAPPVAWHRLLHRLPSSWLKFLRVERPLCVQTGRPELSFWLSGVDGKLRVDELEFRLAAEDGYEPTRRDKRIRQAAVVLWAGKRMAVVRAESFPRRSRMLRLRVYQGDNEWSHCIAEFHIRNPLRPSRVRPGTRTPSAGRLGLTNKVTVTLGSARGSLTPREGGGPGRYRAVLELDYAVRSPVGVAEEWVPERIRVEDRLGNAAVLTRQDEALEVSAEGDRGRVRFGWPLWLDQRTWQLDVEWIRTVTSEFAPDEMVHLSGLPIPPPEGVARIDAQRTLRGRQVTVLGLVGEHATMPGREHDVFGMMTLEIAMDPLPAELRFDVLGLRVGAGDWIRPIGYLEPGSHAFRLPAAEGFAEIRLAIYPRLRTRHEITPEFLFAQERQF